MGAGKACQSEPGPEIRLRERQVRIVDWRQRILFCDYSDRLVTQRKRVFQELNDLLFRLQIIRAIRGAGERYACWRGLSENLAEDGEVRRCHVSHFQSERS